MPFGSLVERGLLEPGTVLYSPVHAKGALVQVGDGHAAQGNGEVNQTAIETSLRGRLQFFVRKDRSLEWPRAETPTHFIVMGMDRDLTKATQIAVQEMIDFLMDEKGLDRSEAYSLSSIAADLCITELVDGNMGVHMMIAKSLFTGH